MQTETHKIRSFTLSAEARALLESLHAQTKIPRSRIIDLLIQGKVQIKENALVFN